MSDSSTDLNRKLDNARDLQSVVRTMKALAASNIGQFEKSVAALSDYFRSVELGIGACLRMRTLVLKPKNGKANKIVTAIVIGSDQGLVGRFNEVVAEFAEKQLAADDRKRNIWSIGARVHSRLKESGKDPQKLFEVPNSVKAIASMIGKILSSFERDARNSELHIFYNQSSSGTLYAPVALRLLPLDNLWIEKMIDATWPTKHLPQIMEPETLRALIREYLFISMFRACAESLKSENASRLASMQRADKNIGDLIENLTSSFNHLRQSQIDEELFDVVSGFESIAKQKTYSVAQSIPTNRQR